MIYTCTLNPSIDYVVQMNQITLGQINSVLNNDKQPGGKGINVSRILNRFHVANQATGFIGGFTGDFIISKLKEENVETDFVQIQEDSRINIKLKGQEETEINGVSPFISKEKWQELLLKIEKLQEHDYLVLSGSIPSSLPYDAYSHISNHVSNKNIRIFVDTKGNALESIIPYQPFLIKPNHHELGELFKTTITTVEEAKIYGRKLVNEGINNVIVSMAEQGAILLNKELSLHANVPKGAVINSVGAGDSLVGGFLATYSQTQDIEKSFQYGVASGSATAFSLGLGEKSLINDLYKKINILTI